MFAMGDPVSFTFSHPLDLFEANPSELLYRGGIDFWLVLVNSGGVRRRRSEGS